MGLGEDVKATMTVLAALAMTGCGGGGGGSSSGGTGSAVGVSNPVILSSTLLTGVAASGGPLVNAPITVTMVSSMGVTPGAPVPCPSAGHPVTDAQGDFSVDISACSGAGFIVLSTTDASGRLLMTTYGPPLLNAGTGAAYVNLTPLTTLVLAAAGGTSVNQALSVLNSSVATFEAGGLPLALAQMDTWAQLVGFQAQPKMALAEAATSVMTWNAWNGGDLFTTPFKADHAGEDAILDSLMLTGGTAGVALQMTDLAGVPLVQATGTSVAAGGYAPLSLPTAVSNALSQAMLYPAVQLIPAARTYSGTMSGTTGSGTCSLTVNLSATSTPGTLAGTCASPATGTVALNGTVTSSGQASFTNGAGLTFTGGVTAMGGAGGWMSGALSGTWTIH